MIRNRRLSVLRFISCWIVLVACAGLNAQTPLVPLPPLSRTDHGTQQSLKPSMDQAETASPVAGNAMESRSMLNPLDIALLKWAPYTGISFPLPGFATDIAFDGANMWVTCLYSDLLCQVRPSDGALLQQISLKGVSKLCFDGANLWVVTGNATITKVRATDGTILGQFTTGHGAGDCICDGTNIWVSNFGGFGGRPGGGQPGTTVTKLRASDGSLQGTFTVGTNPGDMAFDGTNVWVANYGSGTLTKLRASDGVQLGEFSVGKFPVGTTFDGANIWVINFTNAKINKVRASDGAIVGTFHCGSQPYSALFDGTNIWVTNQPNNQVAKLRASDGVLLGFFPTGSSPTQLAFDGANVWIANNNENSVNKF